MTPQALLFIAIQWLAPAAVLAVLATAFVAALKRPATWSYAYCVTACLLVISVVTNHLAVGAFGSHEFDSNGDHFSRFEPTLRLIGLLCQFAGCTACFVGSYFAIRLLTRRDTGVVDTFDPTDATRIRRDG